MVLLRLKRSLAEPMVSDKNFILIFTPEAALVPHFSSMCVLAKTLTILGHNVKLVRCFKVFRRCVVMAAQRLPYVASPRLIERTCLNCADESMKMTSAYKLNTIDLRRYVSKKIRSEVTEALRRAPDDLRMFEYDSIPFGKMCMFELTLETKALHGAKISNDVRIGWLSYIESALIAYLVLDEICRKQTISTIIYFNDYSLNLSARVIAEKYQIPCFTISLASHKNVDRSRYVFFPKITRAIYFEQRDLWPKWRELALNRARVEELTDDIIVRLSGQGSHIYSPAKTSVDIRQALSLSRTRKLFVAYTSSLDEVIAGFATSEAVGHCIEVPAQPFGSDLEHIQLVWLRALVGFIESSADLQLVVRVHPREGMVKGETVMAERLAILKKEFDRPFDHCHFIWPENVVSSYDLGEAADGVLVAWSTIGVEMARLGVPVLASTYGISPVPNDDFIEFATTESEYFTKLERLPHRPLPIHAIAQAYRWSNLFYHGNSLDLGDVVPHHEFSGLPPFRFPQEAQSIEDVLLSRKSILDINYERILMSNNGEVSNNSERLALESQFRRLVHLLCTGEDFNQDCQLIFVDLESSQLESVIRLSLSNPDPHTRIFAANDQHVQYFVNGESFSRFSPMAIRLARLGAQRCVKLRTNKELAEVK